MTTSPVKISHKEATIGGGRTDFMLLGPSPHQSQDPSQFSYSLVKPNPVHLISLTPNSILKVKELFDQDIRMLE